MRTIRVKKEANDYFAITQRIYDRTKYYATPQSRLTMSKRQLVYALRNIQPESWFCFMVKFQNIYDLKRSPAAKCLLPGYLV